MGYDLSDQDLLEIATMICLNFDIETNGEHVLPSVLAEYMRDIAKLARQVG